MSNESSKLDLLISTVKWQRRLESSSVEQRLQIFRKLSAERQKKVLQQEINQLFNAKNTQFLFQNEKLWNSENGVMASHNGRNLIINRKLDPILMAEMWGHFFFFFNI